jgi:uncharacterized membrane protein YkvA (DUF1232 family)
MLLKRFSSSDRPKGFSRFEDEAEDVTRDPERVRGVVRDAFHKISEHRKDIGRIGADLPVLLRLARAWASGEYRRIPLKSIVLIVAAVLYFLNPLDLIPDFLPVIGYLDDAAVVGYVLRTLQQELEIFRAWEVERFLTSGT